MRYDMCSLSSGTPFSLFPLESPLSFPPPPPPPPPSPECPIDGGFAATFRDPDRPGSTDPASFVNRLPFVSGSESFRERRAS